MKTIISNFRAIKSAEFDLDKIALIGAKNGSGKTSLIQALTAALTDNVVPVRGVDKKSASLMVHSGTASGHVHIAQSDAATATVNFPSCVKTSQGVFKNISGSSAGYESVIDMSAAERADLFKRILKADVTIEDLTEAFQTAKIPDNLVGSAWKNICAQGWDAAHASATEKGAKLKGAWEQLTSERYGAKKAASWRPAAYDPMASLTELEASLKNEREWLEAAIVHTAVEELDTAKLREQAAQLPILKKAQVDTKTLIDNLTVQSRELGSKIHAIPDLKDNGQPCPHCKKKLYIVNGKLSTAGLTDKQIAEYTEQLKSLTEQRDKIDAEIAQRNTEWRKMWDCITKADEAAKKLVEIDSQKTEGNATADQVQECRQKVAGIEARLNAHKVKKEADDKYALICINQKICDILAPKGLRLTKISQALDTLNLKLAEVCKLSGWEAVKVCPDMDIEYGGTRYFLLSESYQFRVRVALQATIATLAGDSLILIDRADILDGNGRNGLLFMLSQLNATYKLQAVVAMTYTKKEQVPLLTSIGTSYWIENGTLINLQK